MSCHTLVRQEGVAISWGVCVTISQCESEHFGSHERRYFVYLMVLSVGFFLGCNRSLCALLAICSRGGRILPVVVVVAVVVGVFVEGRKNAESGSIVGKVST